MSFNWPDGIQGDESNTHASIRVFQAEGLPPPVHPAEPDVFARHQNVPGHYQPALANARVLIVGGGGLGSWAALALARSGARTMTIIEPDRFDRTNAPRQLMFGRDLGQGKAAALAQNLLEHMVAGGRVTAIPLSFENAVKKFPLPADVALFLVDNNRCRFEGARFARQRHIPAVFSMLSGDGSRLHSFLQGPGPDDPCLWCAVPDLDVTGSAPCASATIISCLLASAFITFFAHRAVMGWPADVPQFNWREADLLGMTPDRVGIVTYRPECSTCRTSW